MASQEQSLDEARFSEYPVAPVGKLTEDEFVAWCDEDTHAECTRAEWVNGEVVMMLKRAHIEGAPDLIVEIVSPDSESRDWRDNCLDYQAAGVREYWVIDPMSQHAEVYALPVGAEVAATASPEYRRLKEEQGLVVSSALPDFRFRLEWLWPATRPTVEAALQALGLPARGGK